MPRRLKRAGFLVNPKGDDTVPALVGDEAEPARGFEMEVSRRFDIGPLVLDESQRPFGQIDPVNHNTVVPPVRAVEKLPARVHAYLSARI